MPDAATPSPFHRDATLLARSLVMVRRRFGSLVLLGIATRLVGSLVFGPVLSIIVAFLVARKGRYSFGNTDVLAFALSPTGVLTLLVVATLFAFAQTVEFASLLLLGREDDEGVESPFARSAWRTLLASPRLLGVAGRQCVVLGVLAAPFLAMVALTYRLAWSGSDLNYLVEVRPARFWVGAGVAALVMLAFGLIALSLLARWAFAIPAVLIEALSSRSALRASAAQARGQRWRIARMALGWLAATVAVNAATMALLGVASGLVLARVGESLVVAIPTAAALLALHAVLISAVGFGANAVGAFLLLQLYEGDAKPSERPAAPRLSWRPTRAAILAGSAGVSAIALFLSFGLIASLHVDDDIAITGHRGAAHDAPENTVAAFRKAVAAGADYGELDVQLSKDGHVVVAHDADLLRLVGSNRKIRDMTLAELRRVDLGSAFSPEFRGEHVPTLEEIIDAVGSSIKILIEIKVYPGDDLAALVAKTVDVIHRKRFGDRCIVISLSYEALQRVRQRDPALRLGYLVSGSIGDLSRLDVDALMVREPLAKPKLIAEARRRGKAVHAWTVDDPRQLARLWDRGVANVITNDPRTMIATRREIRAMSNVARMLFRVKHLLGS